MLRPAEPVSPAGRTIVVRAIPASTLARLDRLAASTGLSREAYLRRLLDAITGAPRA